MYIKNENEDMSYFSVLYCGLHLNPLQQSALSTKHHISCLLLRS